MSDTEFHIDDAERGEIIEATEKHRTIAEPHADATRLENENDLNLIQYCGYSHCPHCGIGLDNGVGDFDGYVDRFGSEREAFKHQQHEHQCLGCGGEWGQDIVIRGSKARGAPTRHYIGKSTVEGAVALCHTIFNANPELRRKDAIAKAVEAGVTFYTARTQYQKWFKAKR